MTQETIPLIAGASEHAERIALIDELGGMSFRELLGASADAAGLLRGEAVDLRQERVAFLCPPGRDYVVAQWAIWRAGGICVPLCTSHPAPELDYVLEDARASVVIAHPKFEALLSPLAMRRGLRVVSTTELAANAQADPPQLPLVGPDRGAMLLYTSGTTGRPKAVLTTHAILTAQLQSLQSAWEWNAADQILHVLPLHHLHGILNVLCSALYNGACCEFVPRFDAEVVWSRIADRSRPLSLFMAVPAIYAKLIDAYESASAERQAAIAAGCKRLRLMVSGSAALPTSVLDRFRALSGHTLLERYGMTEFGMGLGNPLHGERRPGYVGVPFPAVSVRLRDEQGSEVPQGEAGEIQVRGPGVFAGYFGREQETRAAFTADGWFKTGDVAVCEQGYYRILGRSSTDILKSGGYKISALEIEEVLREHPAIRECAVLGVPDDVWGQRVLAAVVLREGCSLDLEALRVWGKQRLAPYKVPTLLRVLDELPRNAMGKVQKTTLANDSKVGRPTSD